LELSDNGLIEVRGSVVEEDGGKRRGVAGVDVVLSIDAVGSFDRVSMTRTDSDGRFTFTRAPPPFPDDWPHQFSYIPQFAVKALNTDAILCVKSARGRAYDDLSVEVVRLGER
jgi:hypothetical protein